MHTRTLLLVSLALFPVPAVSQTERPADLDEPRPIETMNTVFIEEMTWMEVRDAIADGKTTAIIATGGIEQNGPYLATGKHNIILRATTDRIARMLGDALVAPIVPFVPEGNHDPQTGHMRYPGTISLTPETFKTMLREIALSLKMHGFTSVILIGDSGGNQTPMRELADELNSEWSDSPTRVHFIPDYYDNPRWAAWIAEQGIQEVPEGLHDDLRHSSIMLLVDPQAVRVEQRIRRGLFSINGVDLSDVETISRIANGLVEYQSEITVDAIRAARGN